MPGADFLQLDPAGAPARGVTDWLTSAVRAAVLDGRLAAGDRLPPTRTLAADLRIARGVVVEAYQRLVDEGLVEGRTGRGTVVLPTSSPEPPPGPAATATADPERLPQPTNRPAAEGEIDLSPGVPDLAAFPRAAWLRAERAVLRDASAADLGYGDPRGSARLRRELAGWLGRTRGLRTEPDRVLVVAGVAQALALVAQTLRSRGAEAIGVEDPGSRGARQELVHWGLRPVGVPVDDDGLVVSALPPVPAVMVTPAHQYPTGVVLSPDRRRELLAWARDGGLVIEDDYDAEHRYDRAPVPALQPSAPEHVAHTGSTSKTLAPGMRLGWLVAPAHLDADLVTAKHASDLGSPALPQLVLAELLASGEYDRHLRLVRGRQRARRDALLAALARHLPGARVAGVAAGLHLLVTFPGLDADDVALAGAVREAGVVVHPLSWHRLTPGDPGLVLGYAATSPDRLHAAVERMAAALGQGPLR
ncbi:PLP-dependent aminotransferase family protein [Blastococcus xanthinilyticus]|uniref:GntR family transcriptional regulator/MocR family aminotransferase n=1 Tax=Blastococcus xanthinilyticus TaxID=1564164 RepID=A0A5S5CS44_9ACTN|nr:PLP-dependent aminotransferase family protein [Blastococcus xanthinilyticus]TYP86590.1 GntR family transcriptional regulator/MocR family aminotransferase [Blastococcus xanthinilyticus]